MKDRLKKFYKDNEEVCIYIGFSVAITTTFVVIHIKGMNGRRIESVGTFENESGSHVLVTQKNGHVEIWDKNPTK